MKGPRVIVLGSGRELDYLLRILSNIANVVAFGCDAQNISGADDSIAFCKATGIDIIQHYSQIDSYRPEFVFMISYPLLIPETYLKKYKFINMHGALLPRYRGIHGGTWAMVNGEPIQGYTIHLVDAGIDSGPILFQGKIEVLQEDDINIVRKKITDSFKSNIGQFLIRLFNNEINPTEQDENDATYVCRRTSDDGLIDWNQSVVNVYNLIRALKPPYTKGAYTYFGKKQVHIVSAELYCSPAYISVCGQVVARLNGIGVLVKCADGVILIKELALNSVVIKADEVFKSVGARFTNIKK